MKKILVTDHVFPNLDPENAVLAGIGALREAGSVNDAQLLEMARDADAVLNCYRPLSAEIVMAMENCRIIARYGIGVDTIPLEVATSRRIQVANVPDYCIEEVADHGLALILALTRGIIRGLDQTRGGGWNVKSLRPMHRQRGRTLGLLVSVASPERLPIVQRHSATKLSPQTHFCRTKRFGAGGPSPSISIPYSRNPTWFRCMRR
jgi:D-3-phosphoglycerate dehydrogenase